MPIIKSSDQPSRTLEEFYTDLSATSTNNMGLDITCAADYTNIETKEYHFEYLVPKDKQPWENAYVRGQANDLEEAKKHLLIAMHECGGWAGNEELETLLSSTGLSIDTK